MINNRYPGAKDGCSIGKKCTKCPLYRTMPIKVTHPTTGEKIEEGLVWDCTFAWAALGAWDAGRQSQGVHAAVSQAANENSKRQEALISLVARGQISDDDTHLGPPSNRPDSLPSNGERQPRLDQPFPSQESGEQ